MSDKRINRILFILSMYLIGSQSEYVYIAKEDIVKCPTTHPLPHNSLRVITQEDMDANAVYVNYGRPLLKVIRKFANPAEAREVVPDNELATFDRNSTVYIVDNQHNVNLIRCDRLCCSSQTGVLSSDRSDSLKSDCIRLAVEEGARCHFMRDNIEVHGTCQPRPKDVGKLAKWMECSA